MLKGLPVKLYLFPTARLWPSMPRSVKKKGEPRPRFPLPKTDTLYLRLILELSCYTYRQSCAPLCKSGPSASQRKEDRAMDCAVLILNHKRIYMTQSVLALLAQHGAVLLTVNEEHIPVSLSIPIKRIRWALEGPTSRLFIYRVSTANSGGSKLLLKRSKIRPLSCKD